MINLIRDKLEKESRVTCCNDGIVEAWIVVSPIPLHSLTQLGERLANHLELSLVVILAPVWCTIVARATESENSFSYLVV